MLALSDDQLAIVMTAAGVLPPEKRNVFLERIAARLNLRDPRLPISDTDLSKAIRSALTGLAPAPPKLSGVIGYKEVIAERESTLIGPDPAICRKPLLPPFHGVRIATTAKLVVACLPHNPRQMRLRHHGEG
jgi:hypothetical protein